MKKIFTLFIFLSLRIVVQAQTYSFTSTPTPMGSTVEGRILTSGEYSTSQKNSQNAQTLAAFPNAVFLSDATWTYNCHGWAWNMSEGGATMWINALDQSFNPNVYKYWDYSDGGYIEVCSISDATKIHYYSGDHSANKSSISGKYESKWGSLPRLRHDPTDVPSIYIPTSQKYYAPTKISGPDYIICSTDVYSISVPGASVIWSTSGDISISGSNTANPVTISKVNDGSGTLTATITTSCGSAISTKSITAGMPYYVSNVEVSSNGLGGGSVLCNHEYDFDDYVNTFTYTLNETPAFPITLHYYIIDPVNGDFFHHSVSITSQTGTYILPASLPVGNNYNLEVWVSGGTCGAESQWFEAVMEYANCGSFARMIAYPNPANTELTISPQAIGKNSSIQKTKTEFGATLFDYKGHILKEGKTTIGSENIVLPVADLPNGTYYLHIKEGKSVTRQQVIIQH